jgi:hypothetical protein
MLVQWNSSLHSLYSSACLSLTEVCIVRGVRVSVNLCMQIFAPFYINCRLFKCIYKYVDTLKSAITTNHHKLNYTK